jgi:hypothetical protein
MLDDESYLDARTTGHGHEPRGRRPSGQNQDRAESGADEPAQKASFRFDNDNEPCAKRR